MLASAWMYRTLTGTGSAWQNFAFEMLAQILMYGGAGAFVQVAITLGLTLCNVAAGSALAVWSVTTAHVHKRSFIVELVWRHSSQEAVGAARSTAVPCVWAEQAASAQEGAYTHLKLEQADLECRGIAPASHQG